MTYSGTLHAIALTMNASYLALAILTALSCAVETSDALLVARISDAFGARPAAVNDAIDELCDAGYVRSTVRHDNQAALVLTDAGFAARAGA